MNLYFLVEGTTEGEFYPKFLDSYFGNKLPRIDEYGLADSFSDSFYLISCDGYPYIFTGSQKPDYNITALKSAIEEINDNPVYNYLILCLDVDETSVKERTEEFESYIEKYKQEGVILNDQCEFKLVAQNRCIETWFLGNEKIYSTNPNNEPLISYTRYFNVKNNDPEDMGNYCDDFTYQDFHLQYLRCMLREKRLKYRKENLSKTVSTPSYLEQLDKRYRDKGHIQTFGDFLNFCDSLKIK